MTLDLVRRPLPKPQRRRKGNPNRNRRVMCPVCRRKRTTTSSFPYCRLCKRKMEGV